MSLGFEQAGFDIAAAVEIDPVHASVHKFNFPSCSVIPRSISDVTGEDIRELSEIGDKNVDVVFGGAPCQGFSLIGQRALDDPRNLLVREFVRIVEELNATYFVFENVKGLTVGKQRRFLSELIGEFEQVGYEVQTNWKVLNAAEYGVPQHRQRLILMGTRNWGKLPAYPSSTSQPPSCYDAIGDLPDAERFGELSNTDEVRVTEWREPSKYARELRCLTNDCWHFGYPRIWDRELLTSSRRTAHTDISRRRFRETVPGLVEPISRFFKLAEDGICNTLRAGTDSARGAFTSPRPIHFEFDRCVTVREMARLHGFPDWFRFNTTKWHGARQIGNSVPPPLARAVAKQILLALDVQPTAPNLSIELGDTELLRMNVSEAAAYWGVENPISRRDKKSGAKKRKQSEIEAVAISL